MSWTPGFISVGILAQKIIALRRKPMRSLDYKPSVLEFREQLIEDAKTRHDEAMDLVACQHCSLSTYVDANKFILCNGCSKWGAHLECTELVKVPRKCWYCAECLLNGRAAHCGCKKVSKPTYSFLFR